MKKTIRNLIIGKDTYIESWNEYRQVILSGQYTLIAMGLIAVYSLIDIATASYEILPLYIGAFGLLIAVIFLHRKGDHCVANYFLFPTVNVLIFLLASSESNATGAFVYFIPISLGSFAVFNYPQRNMAIGFGAFSFILFAIAFCTDWTILPWREYSPEEIQMSVAINFGIAFPSTLLGVYLMISINHYYAIELRSSNRLLKKVNEELDRFVYSTSHDLRAPLSSVSGLINLAESSRNPEEVTRYLSMMGHRVKSLDKFIKDITDYARNNRLQVAYDKVNIYGLAQEVWESLKYSPEAREIEFNIEIPVDFVVENDRNRLRVILANLISNAIRYHDQRKEKKYIRLCHHLTPSSFSLQVEDNGQGIPPDVQQRVFDMFYRGNESSQGSGLGLYIVKETISKLSGTIHLSSIPQQGSTFTVNLPARN